MINDRQGNIIADHSGVVARWKKHFEILLNEQASREDTNRIRIEDDGQTVDPPTLDEVRKATRKLKNGNAAGKDVQSTT